MENLKDQLILERLPQHIAIIMDGNGRWAIKQNRPRIFGHKKGTDAVRRVVEAAAEIGIKHLTLYTFSKENWKRTESEVSSLLSLLISSLNTERKTLMDNNVRLTTIGDLNNFNKRIQKKLTETMELTQGNTGLQLVLALSYGARWEILEATKKIGNQLLKGEITLDQISEDIFSKELCTAGIPDPELVIRTSGENRISNFLLWQIAYSELFFTTKCWPDFQKDDLYQALIDYQNRERRFGKTSEQINTQVQDV